MPAPSQQMPSPPQALPSRAPGRSAKSSPATPKLGIVTGSVVRRVLAQSHQAMLALVENAYVLHGRGGTVNPPSHFLRFPDRPSNRIIALPASIGGDDAVDGLKWIASVPSNIGRNLPRASAVIVLNDPVTGYPYACVEGSIVSATRTAASAALAASTLRKDSGPGLRLGFVGAGLIARYIFDHLTHAEARRFSAIGVFDTDAASSAGLAAHAARVSPGVRTHASAESLIRGSDIVVFATTAAEPHITDPTWFTHHPLVLNISLRDLGTSVIAQSANIVDDIDHCLRAGTSVHLASQELGHHDFIDGSIADVIEGRIAVAPNRTVVFSPFGLGMLDLVVARYVYERARDENDVIVIDDFFAELDRLPVTI